MGYRKQSQSNTATPGGRTNQHWTALQKAALVVFASVLGYLVTQMTNSQQPFSVNVAPTFTNQVTAPPTSAPSRADPPPDPNPVAETPVRPPVANSPTSGAMSGARLEPDSCASSRIQSTHDVLEEADAKYLSKDFVGALERYGCVDAKLAAGRRPLRPRVRLALRVTNRQPYENERFAREMFDLFQPVRLQQEDDQ